MKFKSVAIPAESVGLVIKDKKIVVPNQSMSLQEILERFTRNEELPIGRDVEYHDSDDDLEKMSHMDLVDRAEYVDRLKQTQLDFEKQEKRKAQKERKRLDDEVKAELKREAEKAAQAELKP